MQGNEEVLAYIKEVQLDDKLRSINDSHQKPIMLKDIEMGCISEILNSKLDDHGVGNLNDESETFKGENSGLLAHGSARVKRIGDSRLASEQYIVQRLMEMEERDKGQVVNSRYNSGSASLRPRLGGSEFWF
ncbi:hypothetical protein VNO78_23716 [Psophocarpus tetragonolobus]|uniref:Uncharacterized protein n=1 Tax=Psophocarpus tetragonolobus TaxID=3891 RepID=A0AAN9XEN7_PSOTE